MDAAPPFFTPLRDLGADIDRLRARILNLAHLI
jgi:hypothetical protein